MIYFLNKLLIAHLNHRFYCLNIEIYFIDTTKTWFPSYNQST